MGRFEKVTKIDGKEVTSVTSYNNIEIYEDITEDTHVIWIVHNGQVIFSFNSNTEIDIAEEYRDL